MTPCILWHGKGHRGHAPTRKLWVKKFGDIPGKLMVLHHCNNGMCINFDHLYLGTGKQNNYDASKVTEEMVIQIREMRKQGKKLQRIADTVGVSPATVSRIVNGLYWEHVQ